MQPLSSLTHHAVLFVREDRKTFANTVWKELQMASLAHVFHDYTVLDIETARALTSWVNTPYEGNKIALISFHTITLPAQNALLKILEEPRIGVQFILVTSNQEALIPTLYSRLQHQKTDTGESNNTHAQQFLSASSSERMKLPFIASLLTAKDESGRKEREGIRTFILSLVPILTKNTANSRHVLSTIKTASYAGDSSSSGKVLLEYLALLLPQIKT